MLYLNKSCYNGLYRVNSKGQFNVPIGRPMNRKIFEYENLMRFHSLIQNVGISNLDYSLIIKKAKKNDIVYLDPPYDKINEQSFIAYNGKLFDSFDQQRLAADVDELTSRGVFVIFSNSDTQFIRTLYGKYLTEESLIRVRRKISSKADGRILENEILADNFLRIENENKI
jgi:DNA adenine methylase